MLTAVKRKQTEVLKTIQTENALILETGNGRIKIEPYSGFILRITYTLKAEFSETAGLGMLPKSGTCAWSYTEDGPAVTLSAEKVTLVVKKDTGAFSYYDRKGRLLTKEPDRGGKELGAFDAYKTVFDGDSVPEKIATPDGIKEAVRDAKRIFGRTLYRTRLEFEWSGGEALYGLGQHEEGSLNLRGKRLYVHQANMKIAMPFFISTRGYGILQDTYSPLIFSDNEYGSYLYSEAADELDYYFICGENFDELIGGYRSLTGRASMLPLWAFGYIQSQERYESQRELLDTVGEYRRRGLPLDCIVLDWQSWREGMWGQKTFDPSRFPDPCAMTRALHAMNARLMISVWPNMHRDTADHAEMKANDCLLGNSEIYNAFDEKARRLYWKQAGEGLFSAGTDAWWCDSSEPVTPEWNTAMKPEPDGNYLAFHHAARVYIDEAYTNAYPLMHAKAIYEGQRSVSEDKRVVNLTRSGYTGQQKYGTVLWSGDISAKWETLAKQIPAGLGFCASGMPYWTLDIGGFFVKRGSAWFWDGDYEEGCGDLGYRELYTRWFQLSVFLPLFRSHGTDTHREIWRFGEEGELFYDILVKFDRLRYRLLPYIYSAAGMVTQKHSTMMRLLSFDFIGDPDVYDIGDQYMFGSSIMVCPVTKPMYYGKNSVPLEGTDKTREVYLPAGTDWYDFWTHEKYGGGQTVTAKATLDVLPVFVKAGSVVPTAEAAEHTGAVSRSDITLTVFPGTDGAFSLYQDENDNYNYEKGAYAVTDISWKEDGGVLKIGKRYGTFAGMPEYIVFTAEVTGKRSKTVVYDGGEVLLTFS